MKKKKYWPMPGTKVGQEKMQKKSFVIRDAVSNGIRFGLFEPITSERQAKKVMRDFENRMKACGIEVQCKIVKVENA